MSAWNRGLAVAILSCTSLGAAYFFWPQHSTAPLATSLPETTSAANTPPIETGRIATAPSAPADQPHRFSRSELGYRWDASKPGVAASAEDAAWLQSKGFPGPDVEDHLRLLSLQELQNLASRGNPAATAIYAYRLAETGATHEQVLALLSTSARAGSVFALKTAGDIYFTVDGYRDPVIARAYYNLQSRAGDQAGFVQSYLISGQLNDDQRLKSDLMTDALWRSMSQAYDSNLSGEPRPGYIEFMDKGISPNINQED